MYRYIIFILIVLFFSINAFGFDIAKDGKPACNVVLKDGATKAEVYACNEFVKYIEKMSGAKLPVSSLPKKDANNVFIGKTETAKSIAKIKDWNDIKDDEIIIVSKGNNLILSGGKGSGVIYSVYDFLDEYLGVKYITKDEDYIPLLKTVKAGDINKKYISPFISREAFFKQFRKDPVYCLKLKMNGQHNLVSKEYGGHISIYGGAHTFDKLISVEKYGKDHPDWFSMSEGKRVVKEPVQLCLSNKEMLNELTKNLLQLIKENPEEKIFSLSQNDNEVYCKCPECLAFAEKYGNSGLLINALNQVAKELKKQYPNVLIETLAYQGTRNAPKGGIKPMDNILVRLCSIGEDFSKTFDEPVNMEFYDNLKQWSKITKQMYVWDYVVNFSNYIILHPNFRVLQKNLQIMRDNNVIGVFEQGDTYNDNACFGNYKKYIIAKLIWNPDIDFDKETKAFLHAYYGPAEKEMYDFINHINKVIEKTDFKLSIFPYNNAYFNAEDWIYCFKCFNRALKNTENTKYYDRVKFDMLCFQTGFLLCSKKDVLKVYDEVELMYSDPKEFLDYIDNYLPEHDVENYRETENWQKGFFHILDLENKKEGKIPEICNNINNSDWADFQSDKFTDWGDPERQKIVDDETSSNGKARWLNTKYDEWYVTQNLYGMYLDKNIKGGEVYVTYKIINPKEGSCFKVGIYDPHGTWIYNEKYKITEKEFNADPKMKDQWITEKVGDVDFMNCNFDTYIYAACNKNENSADGVLIDRFFVIYDKIK